MIAEEENGLTRVSELLRDCRVATSFLLQAGIGCVIPVAD